MRRGGYSFSFFLRLASSVITLKNTINIAPIRNPSTIHRLQSQVPQITLPMLHRRGTQDNQVRDINRLDMVYPPTGFNEPFKFIQSFKIGKIVDTHPDLGNVNTGQIGPCLSIGHDLFFEFCNIH